MDALLEVLLQLVIELLAEVLYDRAGAGIAALLVRRGRWTGAGTAGLAFGIAWGVALSGRAHYPRLLWVSLVLGVAGIVAALAVRGADNSQARHARGRGWRSALTPPWRWQRDRLIGLVILNLGLAAGILTTFRRH